MRTPSEALECRALVRWLSRQPELLFSHLPLGANTLTPAEAARLKSMGVRAGVPDYLIVNKETHEIVFIEMKRMQGGVVSAAQRNWEKALGGCMYIAYGFKDARDLVKQHLL